MTRRLFMLLLTALALALAVAACGGDDDDDEAADGETEIVETGASEGGGTTLVLTADPEGNLAFDPTELTAEAGEVTIELVNESGIPHNVGIEGSGVDEVSETISEGSTELTVTLEAGEYTFYCAVPGHREGGMEGPLTVE